MENTGNKVDLTSLVDDLRKEFGSKVRLVLSWRDDPEIEGRPYVLADVRVPTYNKPFAERLFVFQRDRAAQLPDWFLLASRFD